MKYFLDTNIVIHLLRNDLTGLRIKQRFQLFDSTNQLLVSVVSVGELKAFALQRNWGFQRVAALENMLKLIATVRIV